jgi:hypothetical protein
MALTFCSLPCFEAHVPTVRHREAWAEQQRAPTLAQFEREQAEDAEPASAAPARAAPTPSPPRRVISATARSEDTESDLMQEGLAREILIVASKLKAYVRARSGMNTSDAVMEILSDRVRQLCDAAIRHAAMEGRKTVLPRDL